MNARQSLLRKNNTLNINKFLIFSVCALLSLTACTTNKSESVEQEKPVSAEIEEDVVKQIKAYCMDYPKADLKDEDFVVTYNGFLIQKSTGREDILAVLGDPVDFEEYNYGYYDSADSYCCWQIEYPSFENHDICLTYLENVEEDEPEIFVGLYSNAVETARGVKVGDSIDVLLEKYGRPDDVQRFNTQNEQCKLCYILEDTKLIFILDETNKKIVSIGVDYAFDTVDALFEN